MRLSTVGSDGRLRFPKGSSEGRTHAADETDRVRERDAAERTLSSLTSALPGRSIASRAARSARSTLGTAVVVLEMGWMGSTAAVKVLNLVPLSVRITDGPDGEVDVEDEALSTNRERERRGGMVGPSFPSTRREKKEALNGRAEQSLAYRVPSPDWTKTDLTAQGEGTYARYATRPI